MRKITLSLATALILLSSFTANAELNMGGKTIFTGTLIEVLEPGPATQIQTIITNILDASASKPYLIHLGPGVYDLGSTRIIMKEWVNIQGSGQEATKITAAVVGSAYSATSAVVACVDVNNTSLTDLTIENTGGGVVSIAIYNINSSPRIERVTATASGGTNNNYGVVNRSSSSSVMTNVIASASGVSVSNAGVRNDVSSPTMTNVTASASGGTGSNTGVINGTSSPTMTNVTASGSGGTGANYGVGNYNSSSPTMTNVTASGSGGAHTRGVIIDTSSPTMTNVTASASGGSTTNYGVIISESSSPFIQDSIMEGAIGMFIASDSPGARIVNSKIIGGVTDQPGTTQCRGNYKADLTDQAC